MMMMFLLGLIVGVVITRAAAIILTRYNDNDH